MRTTPALRSIAAALFTGGVLTVAVAGTAAAATEPTHTAVSASSHPTAVNQAFPCTGWVGSGPWWGSNVCGWNGPGFYGSSFYGSAWNSPWGSSWNASNPGFVVVLVPGGGWTY